MVVTWGVSGRKIRINKDLTLAITALKTHRKSKRYNASRSYKQRKFA